MTPDEAARVLRVAARHEVPQPPPEAIKAVLAERDSLRARPAAQQPVIDAAVAWFERQHEATEVALVRVIREQRAALSGSVEAPAVSHNERAGDEHVSDHADHGNAVEADTPAEPDGAPGRALLREVLDALGMAGTRDWDDVLNVLRCWRKQREVAGTPAAEPAPDEVTATLIVDRGATPMHRLNLDPRCVWVATSSTGTRVSIAHEKDCGCGDMTTRLSVRALAGAGADTEPAEVPTCGVVYAGRFWHGAPCRHGRGHEGRHADVYGRTWTNDADEDAALAEPADDTQETTP